MVPPPTHPVQHLPPHLVPPHLCPPSHFHGLPPPTFLPRPSTLLIHIPRPRPLPYLSALNADPSSTFSCTVSFMIHAVWATYATVPPIWGARQAQVPGVGGGKSCIQMAAASPQPDTHLIRV